MEILLAYGADATLDHSYALYKVWSSDEEEQRKKARLLLQNGANPNAKAWWRKTHAFMNAVRRAKLGAIREMAKWLEDAPQVKEEDIKEKYRSKYDQVKEAIQKGREERKQLLSKRERK